MLEDKVNQIFEKEQSILVEIDSYDIKKKELSDKFEQDVKILETEKKKIKYHLKHFYQMNIATLFEKVVEVMKTNDQVPKTIHLINIMDKVEMGRSYYDSFSISKKDGIEIIMIPETCDDYCGRHILYDEMQTVTFEELIYDNKNNSNHIERIYNHLKIIIDKYKEKEKEK